jgi:hypothetical protein
MIFKKCLFLLSFVTTKTGLVLLVGLLAPSGAFAAGGGQVIKNPYENVNWDRVSVYKANFHSHTVLSDGRAEPGELIAMYAEAGYDILAITDHDNGYTHREGERDLMETYIHRDGYDRVPTAETSWPWTRWIDEVPSKIWVYRGIESSAFYPELGRRGMLAVRGAELSTTPHMSSIFNRCGWPHGRQTDDERLDCVEENGGLAYWAHPTHYIPGGPWEDRTYSRRPVFDDPDWEEVVAYFGDYIVDYDVMLGFEFRDITGQNNRGERDRAFFDSLLARYYPEHDVFIQGSDDNHGTSVPENASMTLVLAEDLTEEAVRHALKNGHNLVGSRAASYPEFNGIAVDEEAGTIVLDFDNYERIIWIKDGEEYATGATLDISEMENAVLRFEVEQAGATFFSQGFYVGSRAVD